MATQPSAKQGNSNHAEQPAEKKNQYGKDFVLTLSLTYMEDVRVSVGSASSQSKSAQEISYNRGIEHYYQKLLEAAFKGDWEAAKIFFANDPHSKIAKITGRSETVLHIAALSAQDQFLENLVEDLSQNPEVLERVDRDGRTALHIAVLCGSIRMVKALVRKNHRLTQLSDNEGRVPLGISALEVGMHKEIARFLAKSTTNDGPSRPFSSDSAIDTIIGLTYAGHHEITLDLVKQYPHLMTRKTREPEGRSILYTLVGLPSHFLSRTRLSVLETLIYKCIPVDLICKPTDKNSDQVPIIKRVHEMKLRHMAAVQLVKEVCAEISKMKTTKMDQFLEKDLLDIAAENGIREVVKLCIQTFSHLSRISRHGKKLTTLAVKCRQERTLSLFLKVNSANELSLVRAPTWNESKDMMLAAAEYPAKEYYPNLNALTYVVGAAFQMQRELQWFKAVETWIIPGVRYCTMDGKTYWEIFVDKHKGLLENGEKWVKDTANSCMLVSTLIATVLFAAAFIVPGGNDSNTAIPLLLGQDSFLVFAISDALGLFSSVTAILLFLAMLTTRYEPQDFLDSLPKKIIMGLSFLFLSLAFMLVAFAATLSIVLDKRLEWVLLPITLLTSVPVFLFLVLELPLLFQMFKSTYGPSIFRPEGIWE
ncbi:hypothetical protein BT93_C1998 [Corymbia citriodora subsp. variegata]|nr:hypothetical protein BT93_C1998 [Corymbia citriodora subsp. variegata]